MAKKRKIGVKGLSKKDKRIYDKLKQQVSRAKRAAKSADKNFNYGEKRGKRSQPRTTRTKAYQKLTKANKELNAFKKLHEIGEINPSRFPGEKIYLSKNTITDVLGSWQFEKDYIRNINQRAYNKITLKNSGQSFNGKKESIVNLLQAYDAQRNLAYLGQLASTPWVAVTYNKKTKNVIIEFIS